MTWWEWSSPEIRVLKGGYSAARVRSEANVCATIALSSGLLDVVRETAELLMTAVTVRDYLACDHATSSEVIVDRMAA